MCKQVININYNDKVFQIGAIVNKFVPEIPFYQKYTYEENRDIEILLNGCCYDEYTEKYHFLIEACVEGDDPVYYIFNSEDIEENIYPLDMRVIPSECFIGMLENEFTVTHN